MGEVSCDEEGGEGACMRGVVVVVVGCTYMVWQGEAQGSTLCLGSWATERTRSVWCAGK